MQPSMLKHGGEARAACSESAASLMASGPSKPAGRGCLAVMAARLELETGLVEHLHAKAAEVMSTG